eukprot:PhM_4_TR15615/c3_g1_i7/m.68562
MKTTDNKNNRINHFRELFRCGYHPTATRAAILMLISSTQQFPSSSSDPNIAAHYTLCAFTTEDVLSFCVDGTRVLVVDVAGKGSNFLSSDAPTCLVVDDDRASAPLTRTAWNSTSPPNHFIFASMHYQRALDWVQQQQSKTATAVSLDMRNTYSHEGGTFKGLQTRLSIEELALPSTVAATSITECFLQFSSHLSYLDLSSLTNVTQIGGQFLRKCSALSSLDLSPLTTAREIGRCFLYGCSGLTSLMSLSLTNVTKIGDHFLRGCSTLTSLDLSPLARVRKIGTFFLCGCAALTLTF